MVKTSQMPLLVIEDSDEDFEMLQILMEEMSVANPIYRFATGDSALDFIDNCKEEQDQKEQRQKEQRQEGQSQEGQRQESAQSSAPSSSELSDLEARIGVDADLKPAPTADIPRPAIILLDLNLPGVDGREVLTQLKQNKALQEIPVIVFTTSSDPTDIRRCYQTGANGYLIKPVDSDQLEQKVQAFVHYWLQANTTSNWDKVNLL